MRDRAEDFEQAGAGRAAVGLGDPAAARAFRDEAGIDFPLLVDENREAYRAAGLKRASLLHLFFPENFRARRRARRAGHRQHPMGKNPLQLGGSFVFGPGDRDLLARPAATFGDPLPVEALLEAARNR